MTKYTYHILSTIDVCDWSEKIEPGKTLYSEDEKVFSTPEEAEAAAKTALAGLSGGRAYNKALESAEIQVGVIINDAR